MAASKTLSFLCVVCFFVVTDVGDCAGTTERAISNMFTTIVDGFAEMAQNSSKIIDAVTEASNYVQREFESPSSFLGIGSGVSNLLNFFKNIISLISRTAGGLFRIIIIIIIVVAVVVFVSIILCLCGLSIMAIIAVFFVIILTVGSIIFAIYQMQA
ncbi:uncharacterized protein [Periplaneta americana]|uniref:uncharacterized protein n=1 Tax=Periplaneta americana TaxID=6978 RepID=UPI0037E7CF9D